MIRLMHILYCDVPCSSQFESRSSKLVQDSSMLNIGEETRWQFFITWWDTEQVRDQYYKTIFAVIELP